MDSTGEEFLFLLLLAWYSWLRPNIYME